MAKMDVKVNWVVLSDEGDTMEGCKTVKDIRAQVCEKRDCFRCDVVLFDGDYNLIDDVLPAPSDVMCMTKPKVTYDAARWLRCLTEEAIGGDISSVERAVRLMKEQENIDADAVLTAALTKCIANVDSCSILLDAGASIVNIISAETPVDHVNTPVVLRDVAHALSTVATATNDSGLSVDRVLDLINGVSAFLAAGPSGDSDHCELLLEHGVLGSICELLVHDNAQVREKAFNMISGVTQKASSQRKDMLVQANIFKQMTAVLRKGIVEVELLKLSIKLFSKSAARMRSAIDSGFTKEVLSLAVGDDTNVAVIAADTYEAIISNANVQMLGELSDTNAIGKLLDMLKVKDVWSSDGHPFASALKALAVFAKKLTDENSLATSTPLRRIEDARILEGLLNHPVTSVASAAKQLQLLFDKRDAEIKSRVAAEAVECKASSVSLKLPVKEEESATTRKLAEKSPKFDAMASTKSEEPNEEASPSKMGGEIGQTDEDDFSMSSGKDDDENRATATGSASTQLVEEEERAEPQTVRLRGAKVQDAKTNIKQKMAPSRGQRKKRNRTQEDLDEVAKDVVEDSDGKDILVLVVQYLATFLNFIAKILGQMCESGATGFCALANLTGDLCPKKHKGGRAVRRTTK